MNSKKADLNLALEAIRKKHGVKVIGRADVQRPVNYIPFSHPALDDLVGGVPRGRVTELIGKPTSGASTLALQLMCAAQEMGEIVVYIDISSTFDPDYAGLLGLQPETLLLVRPDDKTEALDMLYDVGSSGVPGVVVLNSVSDFAPRQRTALIDVISRLKPYILRSETALILIKHMPADAAELSQHAALRLQVYFQSWIQHNHDICGYESQVTVVKGKGISDGKQATIQIVFDNVQGGNA